MSLALFAVIGFFVGYRLEMSRAGYITIAVTTMGFSVGQIVHVLITKSPEAITMLPLVVGLILVLFMLIGALVRLAVRGGPSTAHR